MSSDSTPFDFQTKQAVSTFDQTETAKSVLFWKPPCIGGNWTICPFHMHGHRFNCSEKAVMWRKAKLFGAVAVAEEILAAEDPKDHMALGRRIANFDQEVWDAHKFDIMVDVLMHKFFQNEDYADALIATDGKQLVECSPRDPIWGVGMNARDFMKKAKEDTAKAKGENLLGKALMVVRDRLTIAARAQLAA
jgi:ribA/ribD-fused uncharacterized protein